MPANLILIHLELFSFSHLKQFLLIRIQNGIDAPLQFLLPTVRDEMNSIEGKEFIRSSALYKQSELDNAHRFKIPSF